MKYARAESMLTILLLIATAGCGRIQGKAVAGKSPPDQLVAADGSVCSVSRSAFDKVVVGMKFVCAWHGGRIEGFHGTSDARVRR